MDEMKQTITASGDISFWLIIPVFLIFGCLLVLPKIVTKLKINYTILWAIGAATIIALFLNPQPKNTAFSSDLKYYQVSNKLSYFLTKTYQYLYPEDDQEDNISYYLDEQNQNAFDIEYISTDYPFLHAVDQKDVLGNFFQLNKTQKPNFLFIVIEGLGAAYSRKNAYLGSFTPFIDSLGTKGISFTNFLSTTGLTFGMLPGLLGSLPFGSNGFLKLGEQMPTHASLFSILKKQGYETNFFYGGDAHFDNMDVFLKKQQIDRIIQKSSFGQGDEKLPSKGNGFSWGYSDKAIFKKHLSLTQNQCKTTLGCFINVCQS